MLTREEFKKNPELVFDKAYGSLSGLAIGDSFGDASRKQENRENYAITTDFNSKASWSTDDTEFALLTAKIPDSLRWGADIGRSGKILA